LGINDCLACARKRKQASKEFRWGGIGVIIRRLASPAFCALEVVRFFGGKTIFALHHHQEWRRGARFAFD
jgi:hypothetical protein